MLETADCFCVRCWGEYRNHFVRKLKVWLDPLSNLIKLLAPKNAWMCWHICLRCQQTYWAINCCCSSVIHYLLIHASFVFLFMVYSLCNLQTLLCSILGSKYSAWRGTVPFDFRICNFYTYRNIQWLFIHFLHVEICWYRFHFYKSIVFKTHFNILNLFFSL